jgi:hypothetical protein
MEGDAERREGGEAEEPGESPDELREDLSERYDEHWKGSPESEDVVEQEPHEPGEGQGSATAEASQDAEEGQQETSKVGSEGNASQDPTESVEPPESVEDEAGKAPDAEQLREYLKEKYDSEAEVTESEASPQERVEEQGASEVETDASQEPTKAEVTDGDTPAQEREDQREAESEADPPEEAAEAQPVEPTKTEPNLEQGGESDPASERENDANEVENLEPPDPKEDSADEVEAKPVADSKFERENGEEAPREIPDGTFNQEVEATQPASENQGEPAQDARDESDEKAGIGQDASLETSQNTPEATTEPVPVEARDQADLHQPSPEEATREDLGALQSKGESEPGDSVNSFGESEVGERVNSPVPSEVDRDVVDPSAVSAKGEADSATVPARTDTSSDGKEVAAFTAGVDGRENPPGAVNGINQELSADGAKISHSEAETVESSAFERSIEPQDEESQLVHQPNEVENFLQSQNEFRAKIDAEHIGRSADPTRRPLDGLVPENQEAKAAGHSVDHPLSASRNEMPEGSEHPLATISLKAYRTADRGDIRFDVHTSTIERAIKFQFEDGKTYEVTWGIDGIGQFTKEYRGASDHFVFFVPQEFKDQFNPAEHYELAIGEIREKREIPKSTHGQYSSFEISRSMLESAGARDTQKGDVVSLELWSPSRRKESFNVFGTLDNRVHLSARELGLSNNDRLELVGARKYEVQDFVDNFNKHLPPEMQNVRLSFDKEPMLKVDEVDFPVTGHKLESLKLDAVLRGTLQQEVGDVRLSYGIGRTIPPPDSKMYFWYSSRREESWIVYTLGTHQRHANHFSVVRETSSEIRLGIDKESVKEKVRLTSKESQDGTLGFKIDRGLANHIDSRLNEARIVGNHSHVRGGIAEDLCAGILELDGWEELRRHPFGDRASYEAANEHGPDSLMMLRDSRIHVLFEYKLCEDINAARAEARDQLNSYRTKLLPREIVCAFIGLLDWDSRATTGSLHVESVWGSKE